MKKVPVIRRWVRKSVSVTNESHFTAGVCWIPAENPNPLEVLRYGGFCGTNGLSVNRRLNTIEGSNLTALAVLCSE
jgi:hypothetical protein